MKALKVFLCVLLAVFAACSGDRVEDTDGTVILSITDFDQLPIAASVSQIVATGNLQVGQITVQNFPKDPRGVTSDLQSVELDTVEITYDRIDQGTRVPPPRVRTIFGLVPVNGTFMLENLDILGLEQALNPPLSDLLLENGGFDTETGSELIVVDVRIRFFGRTLSGDEVATAPASFSLELVP
jgi:hypothetical protein